MAVLAIKTEPRCKLCIHEQRPYIDSLLELRSYRGKDEAGVVVNGEYCAEKFAEIGVINPTKENMSVHWRKHCQQVTGKTGEDLGKEQAEALDELLRIINSDEYADTMDGHLARLFDLGMAEIEMRIKKGLPSGITPSEMRWISSERTRRQHNDAQQDLLDALTGGITVAEIKAVKVTVSAKPELPAHAGIIDAIPVDDATDAEWEDLPYGTD